MRTTWPLALVLVASLGCKHANPPTSDGAITASMPLPAGPPAAVDDSLVKELSSRTGIPIYPGALVDKTRSQAFQHLGDVDRYTVPLTSSDTLKQVTDYYRKVLGGTFNSSDSSAKLVSSTPDGGTILIAMEKGLQKGTTILITASLVNPKPVANKTPQEPSQPPAQNAPEATATPAPTQPAPVQPTFTVTNPAVEQPSQPEPTQTSDSSGGQSN